MKFKVGDKVRVREDLVACKGYGGCIFTREMDEYKGKMLTINLICSTGYKLKGVDYWWTDEMLEEVKENKMEKTFREVIADIKEGEVWESSTYRITKNEKGISIIRKDGLVPDRQMFFRDTNVYKLQRKEYTFHEAFEAYEKGKEIEDRSRVKYKKINGVDHYKLDYASNFCTRADEDDYWLGFKEIRGKWYINE